MYGRNITLVAKNWDGDITEVVTIHVLGTPDMTSEEWEQRAKDKINKMRIN